MEGRGAPSACNGRVFVVGCPRSGTTLLQTFLMAHPSIVSLPETGFFTRLFGRSSFQPRVPSRGVRRAWRDLRRRIMLGAGVGRNADRAWKALGEIADQLEIDHPLEASWKLRFRIRPLIENFVAILDAYAQRQGATLWVEKTPKHVFHLESISRFIPDARFVHIVRSGADTVASLFDVAMQFPDSRAWRNFDDIDFCIDYWNASVGISRRFVGDERHRIVRYETLVDRCEETLTGICRFLGVEYRPEMVTRQQKQAERLRSFDQKSLSGPVRKSESKFTKHFDPAQQAYILGRLDSLDWLDDLDPEPRVAPGGELPPRDTRGDRSRPEHIRG